MLAPAGAAAPRRAPPFSPFAPPCDGRVFHLKKRISAKKAARLVGSNELDGQMVEFPGNVAAGHCLLGLGQDAHGEIYVFGNNTGTPKDSSPGANPQLPSPVGVVMKIVRDRGNDHHDDDDDDDDD